MAITVKDIREMEFSMKNSQGYDPDQVDDFLDEVANQLSATVAEDQGLKNKITALEAEIATLKADLAASEQAKAAAEAARAAAEARKPEYDEDAYFKDLQNAMHEALAGARRVADETVAESNRAAAETKAAADAYAQKTMAEADTIAGEATAAAEQKVAALNAEAERLEAQNKEYRENFRKLIQDQLSSLN